MQISLCSSCSVAILQLSLVLSLFNPPPFLPHDGSIHEPAGPIIRVLVDCTFKRRRGAAGGVGGYMNIRWARFVPCGPTHASTHVHTHTVAHTQTIPSEDTDLRQRERSGWVLQEKWRRTRLCKTALRDKARVGEQKGEEKTAPASAGMCRCITVILKDWIFPSIPVMKQFECKINPLGSHKLFWFHTDSSLRALRPRFLEAPVLIAFESIFIRHFLF